MASEQAKRVADMIAGRFASAFPGAAKDIAIEIDAAFNPPCPQCGAAIKPCIKWVCGSWDEAGARQTSVKCVKRSMQAKVDVLEKRIEELEGLLTEQSFHDSGDRTPPDAMT